jgi:hypothetical protein
VSRVAPARAQCTPLLGALLLIGALVGMHHLVAAGCAATTMDHASATAHAVEHGDSHRGSTAESAEPAVDVIASVPLTPSDTGTMAACVAILIALWCAPPLVRLAYNGGERHRVEEPLPSRPEKAAHPPDLATLSISRT